MSGHGPERGARAPSTPPDAAPSVARPRVSVEDGLGPARACRLIANPRAVHGRYPADLADILNMGRAHEGREWLAAWDQLHAGPTPLWDRPALAARLGLERLAIKDESARSPLGSFKALGAPLALAWLVRRRWPEHGLDARSLFEGRHRELLSTFTVASATDGNHGRALAAAARSLGCRCAIVLPAHVNAEREAAIAELGALIIRIPGDYDAAVAATARLAAENGWHVVSDTSYADYQEIPRDVMQGYGVIAAELIEQTASEPAHPAFTHVFVQGGVGGLAAGIASYLWEFHGPARPAFVMVEPDQADCLYQSAARGRAGRASGAIASVMAGLACGQASPLAWRFLQASIDCFLTIADDEAVASMRRLADDDHGDVPVLAGESGAAGLAGLIALRRDDACWEAVGLDRGARVLVINTEGATAPALYRELVGQDPETVRARQAAWTQAREDAGRLTGAAVSARAPRRT